MESDSDNHRSIGSRTGRAAITDLDLFASARDLEGRPPGDIVAWAAEHFAGRVTFATGFGVEGCALIDMIARRGLAVDVFTLDTGLLFFETRDLWERLQARYGVTIRAVRPEETVNEQAARWGPALWERDPDRCCQLRKVEPLGAALRGFDAWLSAARRDQTPDRARIPVVGRDPRFCLVKVSPLAAWSSADVWDYVRAHDVPTNALHERGYPSIGCWPCTTPAEKGEDARAGRWRGRDKTECGLHVQIRVAR